MSLTTQSNSSTASTLVSIHPKPIFLEPSYSCSRACMLFGNPANSQSII